MQVIIPLAGLGTRLRPHTHTKPKPLVNVAGKPVLGHILDKLLPINPSEIIFITGYLGDQIEKYVSSHYDFTARYIEQTERLGQAHAIYLAREDRQTSGLPGYGADRTLDHLLKGLNSKGRATSDASSDIDLDTGLLIDCEPTSPAPPVATAPEPSVPGPYVTAVLRRAGREIATQPRAQIDMLAERVVSFVTPAFDASADAAAPRATQTTIRLTNPGDRLALAPQYASPRDTAGAHARSHS